MTRVCFWAPENNTFSDVTPCLTVQNNTKQGKFLRGEKLSQFFKGLTGANAVSLWPHRGDAKSISGQFMMGLAADRVTGGQVFVDKLEIFPDGIVPAVLHTQSFIKSRRRYVTLANGRVVS
jgi:hypothetical protein